MKVDLKNCNLANFAHCIFRLYLSTLLFDMLKYYSIYLI